MWFDLGENLKKNDRCEKALAAIEDEATKIVTENMSEKVRNRLTVIISMTKYRVDIRE